MNYSLDEFDRLGTEVEAQGGALLPERCSSQDVHFTSPPYNKDKTERRVTQGCGCESLFVSVYDPGERAPQGSGFARACAVCDAMGAWPRYEQCFQQGEEDGD